MSAITITNHGAVAASSHDRAAASVAPAYGLVARVMRRVVSRHLRIRAARELRSLPAEVRSDIGVPDHMVDEVAAEAAARKADAVVRRVLGDRAA